jgi:hypothetical protein
VVVLLRSAAWIRPIGTRCAGLLRTMPLRTVVSRSAKDRKTGTSIPCPASETSRGAALPIPPGLAGPRHPGNPEAPQIAVLGCLARYACAVGQGRAQDTPRLWVWGPASLVTSDPLGRSVVTTLPHCIPPMRGKGTAPRRSWWRAAGGVARPRT